MEFQLHYTEQGQGTPLCIVTRKRRKFGLLFHQIEHFSKKYRVIAVDTRGMENLQGETLLLHWHSLWRI